jgi:acetyl-CoA synthetase
MTYTEMATRSGQVANWLCGLGVSRGDRVLLMLGNVVPLWEVILAAMKPGAVIIPASTLLQPAGLADRLPRGRVRHVVTDTAQTAKFSGIPGDWTPIAIGPGEPDGWHAYAGSFAAPSTFTPEGVTRASDPLLLYFTSGTTAQPKLVGHTQVSYPVGHLSTMYWAGIQPGDVHLNLSSPGWAKHAWSNLFAKHEAVAEAAVVPSPDPLRLAVPKAYVLLAAGQEPSGELAQSIMAFCRERVAPYKRIRRIEFADLPKTISGKIRRVELRGQETASRPPVRGVTEFWEDDFS